MLVEIEQPYGTVITDEQVSIVKTHAVNDPAIVDDEGKKRLQWGHHLLVSADVLPSFPGWTMRRAVDNASTRSLAAFGQRNTTVVNERVSVAVAGLGLLTVNDVTMHRDLCTDALQQELDRGWRILAVCVQPDQRRPDYILGRTLEGHEK